VYILLPVVVFTVRAAIGLDVDATEASRGLIRVSETIAVSQRHIKLFYPKFIPGEHGPTGPINSVISFRILSGGTTLAWRRDPVDMHEIDVDVPPTASSILLDFVVTTATSLGDLNSANLCRIKWNRLLWYPGPLPSDDVIITPSLTTPEGWSVASALDIAKSSGRTTSFKPVSLTRLVDSPVEIGRYFRSYDVTGNSPVRHNLDVMADSPESIKPSPEFLAGVSHIHEEMEALTGSRHYNHYDWLLSLSDGNAIEGLEHHESSEDGLYEQSLIDPNFTITVGELFCHEYFHSYNGKFRRPSGLATPDFQKPMLGELLWVYEGLTQYYGFLLAVRSGLMTQEHWREYVACVFEFDRSHVGRQWRSLSDTTTSAQIMYGSDTKWRSSRRADDFYDEMILVWLEANSMIDNATHGQKGLDDFVKEFYGGESNGPEMRPYTLSDVTSALHKVAPLNWDAFFRERVYSIQPNPTTKGLEASGWGLVYNSTPNTTLEHRGYPFGGPENAWTYLTASIGLYVQGDKIIDVVPGSPADKAFLMPDGKILAVNGRAYSVDLLVQAIAKTQTTPLTMSINYKGAIENVTLEYKGGARYPHLERIAGVPNHLDLLMKPRRKL